MKEYSRGDVVLVGFVFTDESGRKLRPAVLVSATRYQRARQEVVVAAITSNVKRRLFGDYRLAEWRSAGLLFPSLVTGILRTIRRTMIVRKLGALQKRDLENVDKALRRSLGL
ncbi:MAG TPA: type II toxin-antitoxin system PemK/MazF family toxin [Vicinamibacteria bacterium]|nr:type II toxin-antitoxin system PemK/MazF family toxin [Vicinamibacteria bacterium]